MRPNAEHQGSASISRHLDVGGDLRVGGDLSLGHNLRVDGWIDAPQIKGPMKGLFASEADLRKRYPCPEPGWYALVGDSLPAALWRSDGRRWTDTESLAGQPTLWLDRLEADMSGAREGIIEILARLAGLSIQVIPQADYEALGSDARSDTLYLITEEEEEET